MPKSYSLVLPAGGLARTTAFDFFEITPATNRPVKIISIRLSQLSEITDAQDEQLEVTIRRGGTAMSSGSAGTGSIAAASGQALDGSGATSGFTFDAGNTTLATFTSGTYIWGEAWNVRAGDFLIPVPEEGFWVSAAHGGLVVRSESTPADSVTFHGTMVVEEYPF